MDQQNLEPENDEVVSPVKPSGYDPGIPTKEGYVAPLEDPVSNWGSGASGPDDVGTGPDDVPPNPLEAVADMDTLRPGKPERRAIHDHD